MKALILLSNEGSRLRPITCTTPRAMLPVLGKPIIDYTLYLLKRHNITDVGIFSPYLEASLKNHLRSTSADTVFLDANSFASFFSGDDILIISDGIVTDIDLTKMYETFCARTCDALLAVKKGLPASDGGILNVDRDFNITGFNHNPLSHSTELYPCFAEIIMLRRGFRTDKPSGIFAFAKALVESGRSCAAYSFGEYYCDVRDLDNMRKCHRDFFSKKINLPFPCAEKEPGVWIDNDAHIMGGAIIVPPVYIGKGSIIEKGARIESYSSVCENVYVGEGASIKRSIVLPSSHVGKRCALRGCILCDKSEACDEAAIYDGAILGGGSVLGKRSIIRPNVKVWPSKQLPDDTLIASNVVWEHSLPSGRLVENTVSGRINREITPELMCTLGRCCAALLGNKLAVSCDRGGETAMIKSALSVGIQAFGAQCIDFGEQPLPITRSAIRFYSLNGGLAVSTKSTDGSTELSINIIDSCGADISDELCDSLETLLRGDCNYPANVTFTDTEYLFEYKLYYLKQLINSVNGKKGHTKLMLCCFSPWACELLKKAQKELCAEFVFFNTTDKNEFCAKLAKSDCAFGAFIDYKCETLSPVTHDGHILSEFEYSALVALIIMKSYKNAVVYVSDSSPECIEQMAKKYGAEIRRTLIDPPALMRELSKHEELLFRKQFIYRYDAVGALIMLMDFLSEGGTFLSELLSEIPPFFIVTDTVGLCGRTFADVMEKINSENENAHPKEDGVRLNFEHGWALILPYKAQSAFRVISCAAREEYAREIAAICTDGITRL